MKTRPQPLELGTAILASLVLMSCTVTLQHGPLISPQEPGHGEMALSSRAENMKSRIGSGTFTLFAIPIAAVTVEGAADKHLMQLTKDAVVKMGYTAVIVESPEDSAGTPILSCRVKKFKFKNYTYFFPLVFNWGTVAMDISVSSSAGKVLWTKSYQEGGRGWYAFTPTVEEALTKILNRMISDMTTPAFKEIVGIGSPEEDSQPESQAVGHDALVEETE